MRQNKGKGIFRMILLVAAIVIFGFFGFRTAGDIKLGLDLAGGVSITYQAKEANPSIEDMRDTIYKLQKRVEGYSTEAQVYQEGDNRINIDIPGVSDANAILEELGKPGSLVFLDSEGNLVLDGTQVSHASAGMSDNNGVKEYIVQLTFDEEGTKAFADATTAGVGKPIYIVYDNQIVSAPNVREPITGGQCRIDGMAGYEEAENLASTIRIGSLSLELEEIRSNVVGARLGEEAIETSLKAGAIGLVLVVLFMCVFYLLPGFCASLALLLYTGLIVILLSAFEVTLTLPGVAGIILTIGMAVDANVIISTRIKEEIGLGTPVDEAIKAGFAKALSAIVDGNITTLIAAAVLYKMGSGTVVGFASTLAIGIILSMFTALFVTRFAIWGMYHLGFNDPKFYGIRKPAVVKPFLKYRKMCMLASLLVIFLGFGAMGLSQSKNGIPLNYSMEFMGGTSTNVTFNEDLTLDYISSEVVPVIEQITGQAGTQTTKVAGSNEVIFRTRTLDVDERQAFNDAMAEHFGVDKELITADSVSGAISDEMRRDAIVAVLAATVCMLVYIRLRFSDITFAASSVLALVHDVLVVLTFYATLKWTVGSTFIACMLTIVGYSINATIVIFDRIRENIAEQKPGQTLEEIVNLSISQTLTRSINTSLTTFIMVLVLYILGVSSIKEFALPLMVGIVCGTYSSVMLTGGMWYEFMDRKFKRAAEKRAEAEAAYLAKKKAKKEKGHKYADGAQV